MTSKLLKTKNILVAGHRGFKNKFPENTILAFDEAISNGCTVIETDLHITVDREIVITHDTNTTRTYGKNLEVNEVNYIPDLCDLKTVQEPHLKMPIFKDVLNWCYEKNEALKSQSNNNNGDEGDKTYTPIMLMLDIKRDNHPELIAELVLKNLNEVGPNKDGNIDYWKDKILYGIWESRFYSPKIENLFDIVVITIDSTMCIKTVNEIYKLGGTIKAVSLLNIMLSLPARINRVVQFCVENNLKVWFWTINNKYELNRAIEFCKVDSNYKEVAGASPPLGQLNSGSYSVLHGIMTDDPALLLSDVEQPVTLRYRMRTFGFKVFYVSFVYFMNNGYNVRPVFMFLRKIGFL